MTPDAIRAAITADPAIKALVTGQDWQGAADSIMASTTPLTCDLNVDEVFAILFNSGDWATIRMAVNAGDADAKLAYDLIDDARQIGPGKVSLGATSTGSIIATLVTKGLLSSATVAALTAASQYADTVTEYEVRAAVHAADGSLLV